MNFKQSCMCNCTHVPDRKLVYPSALTSEFLVVGRDHNRKVYRVGIMQTGEELFLSSGGEEVFLLLMACQVHHPSSYMCYNQNLKKDKCQHDIHNNMYIKLGF